MSIEMIKIATKATSTNLNNAFKIADNMRHNPNVPAPTVAGRIEDLIANLNLIERLFNAIEAEEVE